MRKGIHQTQPTNHWKLGRQRWQHIQIKR